MAENKLSDKKLRSLLGKSRDTQVMLADGKGMSARVSMSGYVSFVYQFRLSARDKTTKWITLGRYPDLSLSEARRRRDECRSWLAEGKDPRYQKRADEQQKKDVTVKVAFDYWYENYALKKRRRCTDVYMRINRHILSTVGEIPLNSVSEYMWCDLFETIGNTAPVTARMVVRIMKQAITYCNARRFTDYKILTNISSDSFGDAAKKRSRFLTKKELLNVWVNCNIEVGNSYFSPQVARVIYISLVFGCRISEAIYSTWDEWDLNSWIWTVPASRSKNKQPIVRPIPYGVRSWIKALKITTENKPSIIGIGITQQQASCLGLRIWRRMGHSPSWCLHDLRRTFATHLCDIGIDHYVIEQLLGHTLPGVMGIYNRSQQLDKKIDALNQWVNYLDSLLDKNMIKLIERDDLDKMPNIERMLREDECKYLTSLDRTHRALMEREGRFPKKVQISPAFKAYRLSDIQAWIKGEWKPEDSQTE